MSDTEGEKNGVEQAEDEVFNFTDWALRFKLSRKTTGLLTTEECTSREALRLLGSADVMSMDLPLGQRKLLTAAVEELKDDTAGTSRIGTVSKDSGSGNNRASGLPETGTSSQEPSGQQGVLAGEDGVLLPLDTVLRPLAAALQSNLQGEPRTAGDATPNAGYAGTTGSHVRGVQEVTLLPSGATLGQPNPATYLRQPTSSGKPLSLLKYLPASLNVSEHEIPIAESDGGRIVLKSGPKRPRPESLSPQQWFSANCRAIAEMIENQASTVDLLSYITYLVKTCDLADRFDWPSIMLYDAEYRELQARQGFPWGADMPHCQKVYLREKPRSDTAPRTWPGRRPGSQRGGGTTGGRKMEPCRLYNVGRCNFANCIYRHVCSVPECGQAHPQTQHPKNM